MPTKTDITFLTSVLFLSFSMNLIAMFYIHNIKEENISLKAAEASNKFSAGFYKKHYKEFYQRWLDLNATNYKYIGGKITKEQWICDFSKVYKNQN